MSSSDGNQLRTVMTAKDRVIGSIGTMANDLTMTVLALRRKRRDCALEATKVAMHVVIDNFEWFFGFKTTRIAKSLYHLLILLSPPQLCNAYQTRKS